MTARQVLLVMALAGAAVQAGASERADVGHDSVRELRICVDPDNPPLSVNKVGAPPGFDVEIGQAIAERLGLSARLIWVDTTYGGRTLRRTLLADQCELFMGLPVDAAAQTPDALALTAPYYGTGYRLVGPQDHLGAGSGPADVRSARIGVERQSGAHMRLERIGSRLVVYGSQRQVLDAVARGEVDVGAIWLPDIDRLLRHPTLAKIAFGNTPPDQPLRWNVAIGVRRAEADLRVVVSRVVSDLLRAGEIEAIFNRYGVPFFPPFADR